MLVFRFAGRRWRRLGAIWGQPKSFAWGLDVLFAVADLVGFFDGYEALTNALAPGIRSLRKEEIYFLKPIFGDSIPWHLIRVDERAWVGPSWARFYYVSFHTINSWGDIPSHTLVHEVVHVWQYSHRGAAYIPRALGAQWSEMGYNYGGIGPLERQHELEDFNYEQQADIIEDAFRLTNGFAAQWHGFGAEVLPVYYPYLREVLGADAGAKEG
ncbi:MAG: hypothetical protein ACJAZ9_001174 [Neolewinella sp.]